MEKCNIDKKKVCDFCRKNGICSFSTVSGCGNRDCEKALELYCEDKGLVIDEDNITYAKHLRIGDPVYYFRKDSGDTILKMEDITELAINRDNKNEIIISTNGVLSDFRLKLDESSLKCNITEYYINYNDCRDALLKYCEEMIIKFSKTLGQYSYDKKKIRK